MKIRLKQCVAFVLCLLMVLSLTACANKMDLTKPLNFDPDHPVSKEASFVAAENERYQLQWDGDNKRAVLYDKIKDCSWSSVPEEMLSTRYDEDGFEITNPPKMESVLSVDYVETENYTIKSQNGYVQCLKKGKYSMEKLDDGFILTYYFDSLEISVPVSYRLTDDGFSIGVDPTKITESGANNLYRITLAPFVCCMPNIAEDAYLFYPSGSGALIYADGVNDISTTRDEPIYGEDGSYWSLDDSYNSNRENVKMPVYGAKVGNKAMMGIVTKGAESGVISCDLENQTFGYSSVYSYFYVRGRQTTTKAANNSTQYSDEYASSPIEIRFIPLYDDQANYVGMANRYREYLIAERGLTDREETASVNVEFLGGTQIPTSFLGIPTTDLFATTTVNRAGEILKELKEALPVSLVADLYGFGSSGVDIGKPGGGLKIAKAIGTKKQMKNLAQQCRNDGIDLYLDYEMVYFSSDGSGLTTTNGGATRSPSHLYNRLHAYQLGTGRNNGALNYYLVDRRDLLGFADKVINNCSSLNVSGLSATTLSNVAYSDYGYNSTFTKGGMGDDVQTILNRAKDAGLKFLGFDANDYAAALSDHVIEAPILSNQLDIFDADVPFYQIVFKGYVPMYGTAMNTVTDTRENLLHCVENGCSLRYSLIGTYSVQLLNSDYQLYATRLYEDQKDDLIATVQEMEPFYRAINDAKIVDHTIVDQFVRLVEYDNGTKVLVNYGDEAYSGEYGMVEAKSYSFTKGGVN